MPSMPALEGHTTVEEDDGTFAVAQAGTETVVQLNGVTHLDLVRADDGADHLEAIDRIAATRMSARLNR